ncbi:MAG: secondary thiamine-phosphate synthase enzyme YjbQ [Ignavibacteriales bacterium]|nr:secondary thiamine-phosphate synthase enzyme YjbQ [Ignavibacteriales bacterium]MCF8306274.1 secondary thiamine-phosphate synthase enzyme YjbQ [Ignavibacteriales bacterium]MCF8315995.1 secondary thiamine-phosphate synthase enzyme YjbQ [Ignavibacteriales bacterium]MCF8437589.1 secondary thiamine-phosphate synthase enzyme YjbQ [Ignavibacteriales bacterium]
MKIITQELFFDTKGNDHILDITMDISVLLRETGLREGSLLIFIPGATAAVTTIEHEPGLLIDYPAFFEKIIPKEGKYYHDETWHDGNGHAHIRASLQGPSLTIPFSEGTMLLGTWQQIILLDFDNRERKRRVIVQFTGLK